MAKHIIKVEDLIEVNMSIENNRPILSDVAERLYRVINMVDAGDTIQVEE